MTNTKVYFRSFFNQLFAGSACLLCQQPSLRDLPLCPGCQQDLPLLMGACPQCAEPFTLSSAATQAHPPQEPYRCGRCLKHPPAFDQTCCPLIYDFPVNWLMQNFKHHFDGHSFSILCQLLLDHLRRQYSAQWAWPDLLIPVPLHPKRRFERGFDQAAELAQRLGKSLEIPVDTRSCHRCLDTPQQQGLDAKQRRKNLRHAFDIDAQSLHRSGLGSHVALVDDVMTTGSTAQALSAKLKRAGVKQIDIWCLARTPIVRR